LETVLTVYEQFFGLRKSPFGMSPDPAFLFLTPAHREALAGVTYAIAGRKGFAVLTGEAGTGKTTVLSTLLRSVPSTRAHFSLVLNPTLTPSEFLELALLDFGISDVSANKAQRLIRLQRFLLQACNEGKLASLIVDEAHRLSPEVLEEIRLLTNLETPAGKLLQIVLAGQNELNDLLNRADLRQVKQRVAVHLRVKPLSGPEVEQYIRHRWKKAGASKELPFRPEAISRITECSRGIPRVINAICDNALLLVFAAGEGYVGQDHILEVASDLDLVEKSNGNGGGKGLAVAGKPPAGTELRVPAPVAGPVGPLAFRSLDRYMPEVPKLPLLMRWATKFGLAVRARN
jgi:general secretion pathway protein A